MEMNTKDIHIIQEKLLRRNVMRKALHNSVITLLMLAIFVSIAVVLYQLAIH